MTRRLDRLQASNAPGLPRGVYTNQQRVCEQVEALFDDIQGQVTDIAAALAAALAAQSTADTVKRDDKITGSSIVPANVITATDNGTNATITIAAHTRIYGDGTQLNVAGDTMTGAYATEYGIYYNDTTTSDTTPNYQKTTTLSRALNSYAAGRHFIGNITTPAAAAPPTTGGYSPPATGADTETDRDRYSTL